MKYWRLNIQLFFITDGLRKPGKKRWGKAGGRGGGKVDADCIRMLHKMFAKLHVPYHQAPGEAEAECARLQQLGIVDAVWSDDGDCLMFGCTTLVKAHRDKSGKKDWERICLYKAETLLPRFDFDTDSLVMFAVVAGGDYDDKGLPGCGPTTARKLVKRSLGLAQTLRHAEKEHLGVWREMLSAALAGSNSTLRVPPDFPDLKALNGYRNPAISDDEQCFNLRGLRGGWDWLEGQMNQPKLRDILRDHYNFSTREYLKHLAPVFLARKLTRDVTDVRRQENLSYGVALRRTMNRKAKDGTDLGLPAEINIKFSAAFLVEIDLSRAPPGEDWTSTVKGDGVPYDPMQPLDSVMLSCFLKHGLPEGALDKPEPSPKKKRKKSSEDDGDLETPAASQSGTQQSPKSSTTTKRRKTSKPPSSADAGDIEPSASQPNAVKKRAPKVKGTEQAKPAKKPQKSKTAVAAAPASPPRASFRRLEMPDFGSLKPTNVIDLEEDSSDEEEFSNSQSLFVSQNSTPQRSQELNQRTSFASTRPMSSSQPSRKASATSAYPTTSTTREATRVSPPRVSSPTVPQAAVRTKINASASAYVPPSQVAVPTPKLPAMSHTPVEDVIPGDVASALTLRQRREAGLLSKLAAQSSDSITNRPPVKPATIPPEREVIVID